MKTLKKILVMCMTLVVMVGVTGCVDSDKQERLIQFINVDLAEATELESEANDLYSKIMWKIIMRVMKRCIMR